ncbi:exosome complex exonuclease DIS3/RRP44, partial [Pancytospora epiphaga]
GPTAKVGTDIEEEVKAIMQHYDIDYAEDNWLTALNERREELGLSKYENTQLMTDSEKTYSHSKEPGSTPESVGLDSKEYSIDIAYEEVKNGKREDLRCLNVYSIDPKGCTDIDDALHAVQCDGYVEVGVHIADVSLFVKPDTPLDLEAKNRSTTVYFPQKRFDMLPSFLSANLCSLVQGADRPAISCIWRFDESYNVIDMRVCRSVICSKGSLSYEEAAEILRSSSSNKASDITAATSSNPFNSIQNVSIDSQVNYNNFLASIKLLGAVASKLRTDRFEKGALELNKQEDHGDSDGEEDDGNIPTYYLVEEFMLLANVYIAKFIYKHNPDYSLLRKHPLPSAIDLEFVDCTSSKTINESLKHIPSENLTIVKRIITRSMQQALYFSSGESSDFYHYGLATEIYTHFTSPIRRYPDILVHRTLGYILDGDEEGIDGLSNYVTTRACSFMNYRNRNAQNASRMVTLLYLYNSMEHEAEPMDATVVSPRDGGYIVFIGKYGIEEYLPAKREFNIFDNVKVSFVWNIKQYCTTWNIPLFIVD